VAGRGPTTKPTGTGFQGDNLGRSRGATAPPADLAGKALDAARSLPAAPAAGASGLAGLAGLATTLVTGFVAGRYLTSGGELNWLHDTGQLPRYVTRETMDDASRALDNAGNAGRPSMQGLSPEQRGRFLQGAAVIGREAGNRTAEETSQALRQLRVDVAQLEHATRPIRAANEIGDKLDAYRDELSARYGNLDEPMTVPTPAPLDAPPRSDDDERKRLNVGTRSVLVVRNANVRRDTTSTAIIDGAITYIHVPRDPKAEQPRNLIIHRLIHDVSSNTNPGHEAIHLISGFGLNGKGADRIPAPFPLTQLDGPAASMSSRRQRNINGIAVEMTTDGLYEALKQTLQPGDSVSETLPVNPEYRDFLLGDFDNRTGKPNGKPIELKSFPRNSDLERQVYELAGAGVGLLSIDAASGNFKYTPDVVSIDIHTRNFRALLASNPAVRQELVSNLNIYSNFMSEVAMAATEGREPVRSRLEMSVSPQTTRALIETALKSYQEIHALYPTSPAFPELIIYYRSILQRGEDGVPLISQAPDDETSRTG
jgi:hypothetical protein